MMCSHSKYMAGWGTGVMICKVLVVQGVYMLMFNCVMVMKEMGVMIYNKNMAVQGVYMAVKGMVMYCKVW